MSMNKQDIIIMIEAWRKDLLNKKMEPFIMIAYDPEKFGLTMSINPNYPYDEAIKVLGQLWMSAIDKKPNRFTLYNRETQEITNIPLSDSENKKPE